VVQSKRKHTRRTLFRVLRQFVFGIAPDGRHEARRRGHREARLEPAQPCCLCASAGVARDANVPRIDLRAREQIVERTDAVPHKPRALRT
jgi:hypothetical protein